MKPQDKTQLISIITTGVFPVEDVTFLGNLWIFEPSDVDIDSLSLQEQVRLLSSHVCYSRAGYQVPVANLSLPLFNKLLQKFIEVQQDFDKHIQKILPQFISEVESRALWKLYKNCPTDTIVERRDGRLNNTQRQWILLNTAEDQKDRVTLIKDVFEMLQPWLDKELYKAIKDKESSDAAERTNVFYDDVEFEEQILSKNPEAPKK